jgi:hypothetical protein
MNINNGRLNLRKYLAFSVPHFGQRIRRSHMKTPARLWAVRVKTFMAGSPDYLDSSVPT